MRIQYIKENKCVEIIRSLDNMKRTIDTPKGKYEYESQIVYEGIKKIDKLKAKENLLLFKSIADRNGLVFSLSFGTFLGAMREHDFIEHDEDIDLFVLNEDKEIFLSMLFDLHENGFEVIRYDRRDDLCSIMRNGEYIDILFFRNVCENVRQAQSYFLPERFIVNLKEYEFQGAKFLGPRDGEQLLQYWYGENWNVPIQRDDFNMPYWKRVIVQIKWKVYENMPQWLFSIIYRKRLLVRIKQHNERVERYYRLVGEKCEGISSINAHQAQKIIQIGTI